VPDRADYVFVRPNGKPYRPNSTYLRAEAWENPDGYGGETHGTVVIGTLNPDEAWSLAYQACNFWYGEADTYGLGEVTVGWWRAKYGLDGLAWLPDDERGQPGVMFTWMELDLSTMNWCGFCLIPVPSSEEPLHEPGCPTLDPTTNRGETHG
jgi:hypothetical protein